MKPGRELDAVIAEKVFGFTPVFSRNGRTLSDGEPHWSWIRFEGDTLLNPIPDFSTNIEAAWQVVEKVLPNFCLETNGNKWFAGSRSIHSAEVTRGESAPHAICLAALKMVEKK